MKDLVDYKTRNQCNLEAIKHNPSVAVNLANDADYCIRGKVNIIGFDLYTDYVEENYE